MPSMITLFSDVGNVVPSPVLDVFDGAGPLRSDTRVVVEGNRIAAALLEVLAPVVKLSGMKLTVSSVARHR